MAKHMGETSLVQLLSLVKEKIDTLLNKIEEKQEPFKITAKADFVNGVLTNVSHTFAEIEEACERGDHVYIDCDISQLASGRKVLLNLVVLQPGDYVVFENVISINGHAHIRGDINAENENSFTMTDLVPKDQISNLRFVVSSSVPTVDDRSVITFVVEG